ncbi:MAG TPA: N-acetyltransferase [Nannocystis exedens]|nr:N-acetyltransferase [Nannocystis exedens]
MAIEYRINHPLSADLFIDVLKRSTLSARRPVEDRACMEGMLQNSNLQVSAWDRGTLVGIARALTDFHYACYLSDLAVDVAYQGDGIGSCLQRRIQGKLGPHCKMIVISAPAANAYYEHIGYINNPRCWVLAREQSIGTPRSALE